MAARASRAIVLVALLIALVGCTSTTDDKVSTPVDSGVVTNTPQSMQEPRASTPSVNRSGVFGGGVVDLLNAVDLGDRDQKLSVCRGVSDAVAGMTQAEIDDAKARITDYDRSALQDLVSECEAR